MKWDYLVLNLAISSTLAKTDILKWQGDEGWELVAVVQNEDNEHIIYLKRPKHEPRGTTTDSL